MSQFIASSERNRENLFSWSASDDAIWGVYTSYFPCLFFSSIRNRWAQLPSNPAHVSF